MSEYRMALGGQSAGGRCCRAPRGLARRHASDATHSAAPGAAALRGQATTLAHAARRVVAALVLLLAFGPVCANGVAPVVADSDVLVERSGSSFSVEVVMHVPVPVALAWAVLTDFDHMADFVPNLKTSQVVERGDSMLKISQKGTARYGVFTADFESMREIRLVPQREIHSHAVGGSAKRMDSVMRLEAEEGGTRLRYSLQVQPAVWFPPLIGPALVRHETAEQFSAVLREMVRRK